MALGTHPLWHPRDRRRAAFGEWLWTAGPLPGASPDECPRPDCGGRLHRAEYRLPPLRATRTQGTPHVRLLAIWTCDVCGWQLRQARCAAHP